MCACVLLGLVVSVAAAGAAGSQPYGPDIITTCEDFERDAYFNPYDVVDSMWKIFYMWANTTELYPISFSLPSKSRVDKIRAIVKTVEPDLEIDWHTAALIMEPRPGLMVIFLDGGTPGAYRALIKMEQRTKVRPHPLPLIKFADVRLKLVGRYMGMMSCEELTAYALARAHDLPASEEECARAALKLDVHLPGGACYLHVARAIDDEL